MSDPTELVNNDQHAAAGHAPPGRTATERLGKQAKKVTEDLQALGGIAGDVAQETLEQLRDNAVDYCDEGRAKAHQVERTFEQYIRDKPLKSILIAAGIGLLLGRFWMRR